MTSEQETAEIDHCPECGREVVAVIQSWEIGVKVAQGDVCSDVGRFPHRYFVHTDGDADE